MHKSGRSRLLAAVVLVAGCGAAGCAGSNDEVTASGTIAFVGEKGSAAFVIQADGSGRRRLTRQRSPYEHVEDVAWSPNGRKIAYSAYDGLLVMNADGTGQRRLTRTSDDWRAVWSPHGRKIAFDRQGDGNNWIYVINADGTELRQLTGNLNWGPSWSPDGRRIAYIGSDEGVHTINVDGSADRRVTRTAYSLSLLHGIPVAPSWSPDGRQIALLDGGALSVMNADGTGLRVIPTVPGKPAMDIAWSPDGTQIAFTQGDGDWEIFVVNVDGTGLRNLTDNSRVQDLSPSWSPDGRAIAFTRGRGRGGREMPEVYLVNADGTGERRLTSGSSAVWSPNG